MVAAGAELYTANCATFHGVDLQGTETGPPFLDVIYAPIDGLSRAEVAMIVEFVRSEQEAAGIFRDPSHG